MDSGGPMLSGVLCPTLWLSLYSVLIIIHCLQCRYWILDRCLLASPCLVIMGKVWAFPSGAGICSGSAEVPRVEREKISFVSTLLSPQLVETWVRFPTQIPVTLRRGEELDTHKRKKKIQKKECVSVYVFVCVCLLIKQKKILCVCLYVCV